MKRLVIQLAVSVVVIATLVLLYFKNGMMHMNSMMQAATTYTLIVGMCLLFGMFLFESAGDERELHHRNISDRRALFVAFAILAASMVYGQMMGSFDIFTLLAIAGIIITKAVSRIIEFIRN